ncbi:MAG: hypothetical protein ACRDNS_27160 [Trebonia sp.]
MHKQGGVGISGSVTINDLHNDKTLAYIADGVTVTAGGTLTLAATASLLGITIAGVSSNAKANPKDKASGDGSALAGGFAWDDLGEDASGNEREVEAYTDDVTLHAQDVNVSASDKAQLFTFALGGALAGTNGKVALIGSVGLDQLDLYTLAALLDGTTLTPGGGITPDTLSINATSTLLLVSAAGGAAYTGQYGIGAGADVGIIHDTVLAQIGANDKIVTTGNVTLAASADETVISVAAELAIARKNMGVAGAGAVVFLDPTVQASIGAGATVTTGGSLLLDATDSAKLIVVGGMGAFGKNLGIGASVGYGQVDASVLAFIAGGATIVA